MMRHVIRIRGRAAYSLRAGTGSFSAVRSLQRAADAAAGPDDGDVDAAEMKTIAGVHLGLQAGPPRPAPSWPLDHWKRRTGAELVSVGAVQGMIPPSTRGLPPGAAYFAVIQSVPWTPLHRIHRGWIFGSDRDHILGPSPAAVYTVISPGRPMDRDGKWLGQGGLLVRRVLPILDPSQTCLIAEDRRILGFSALIQSGAGMWMYDTYARIQYIPFDSIDTSRAWAIWPSSMELRGRSYPGNLAVASDLISLLWSRQEKPGSTVELFLESGGRMQPINQWGNPESRAVQGPEQTGGRASAGGRGGRGGGGTRSRSGAEQSGFDSRLGKVASGPVNVRAVRKIFIANPASHRDLYTGTPLRQGQIFGCRVPWSADGSGRMSWIPSLWRFGVLPETSTRPLSPGITVAVMFGSGIVAVRFWSSPDGTASMWATDYPKAREAEIKRALDV